MGEVEAVVRSLSVAMQMEHRMLLPLLDLKRFDQYTTTHACNVSVLAMGLAERLGLGREEVRSFGVAGLLHDLGKIRIPKEILTKPGKLSDEERAVIQAHPVEGARIVLSRERGLGVAAVVAYEHHVCIDGGGISIVPLLPQLSLRQPHRARLRHLRCALHQPALSRCLGTGEGAHLPRVARRHRGGRGHHAGLL